MSMIQEQKCPNCMGPLRYDPASEKMVCDYCGSVFSVEELNKQTLNQQDRKQQYQGENSKEEQEFTISGFDFHSLKNKVKTENAEALPVYVCNSCGAQILAATEEFSLTCPYCQNNLVLTDKVSGNYRPDSVIPFKITPDKLPGAVKKYYKGQKFLPRSFFSENKIGKVTGIYVPFWVFKGKASGKLTFYGEKPGRSYSDAYYDYQEYKKYHLSRNVSLSFKDIPVDASRKMDDSLMDSIEPFDMQDEKKFEIGYLAGFAADRFDMPPENIASRAEKRMCNTAGALARREVVNEFQSVKLISGSLGADIDARYVLMPVYQFDLEYAGKTYKFAVNGQTGKVAGELPYEPKMKIPYFLIRMGIPAAAFIAIFIAKYFLGG